MALSALCVCERVAIAFQLGSSLLKAGTHSLFLQGDAFSLIRDYVQLSTLILKEDSKRVTGDGLLSGKIFLKE